MLVSFGIELVRNAVSSHELDGLLPVVAPERPDTTAFARPDIAYYVSFLCQFMQQPSPAAWLHQQPGCGACVEYEYSRFLTGCGIR